MRNWKIYYKKHSIRKPRKQLLRALDFCVNKESALDLGSGTLVESKAIIKNGFKKVVAIDNSPDTEIFARNFKSKKLDFHKTSFRKFKFKKETFDLINAQFALPFYGKRNFKSFIKKILTSLKTEGVFVGQFFGVRDEWNISGSILVFNTKKEIREFFSGLELIELIEEEEKKETVSGDTKKWHVFHFIVRKKAKGVQRRKPSLHTG
ncbi:MAG: class I SAM-dependent methyltransferase [Candidatus Paceibacterota bacterium]